MLNIQEIHDPVFCLLLLLLFVGGRVWIFSELWAHTGLDRAGSGIPRRTRQEISVLPYGQVSGQVVLSPIALPGFPLENSRFHLLATSPLEFWIRLSFHGHLVLLAKDPTWQHGMHSFIHSLIHSLIQQPRVSAENSKINTTWSNTAAVCSEPECFWGTSQSLVYFQRI